MRYLFIAPRYHTNQAPIMKELTSSGHQVKFFVQYKSLIEDYSCVEPLLLKRNVIFKIIYAIYHFFFKYYKHQTNDEYKFERNYMIPAVIQLYREIKHYQPDVVIIRERAMTCIVAYIIAHQILNIPCILYNQSPLYVDTSASSFPSRIMKKLVSYCSPEKRITPVLGNSSHLADKSAYYLPFLIEPKIAWKDRKYTIDQKIHLLVIGKFVERKNHLLFLKAILKLRNRYPLSITLIGECSKENHKINYDKVIDFIKTHKLDDIVTVLQNVHHDQMSQYYKQADVFILPSRNEPAAVSILEAMAYGCSSICSNTNGTQNYIKEGYNGYVFQSDDEVDLGEKLEKIIVSRENIELMGKQAWSSIIEHHNPQLYDQVIKQIVNEL